MIKVQDIRQQIESTTAKYIYISIGGYVYPVEKVERRGKYYEEGSLVFVADETQSRPEYPKI